MGTYIPNKQTRQQTQKLRVQRTEAYAQRVKREYEQAVNSILALKTSVPDLPTGQMYSFDGDTKKVQRQVNTILRQLHSATLTTIKTGVETEWEQANKEVDSLLRSALGKKAVENPDLAGWFSRNEEAMDAFLKRSNEGMNLSDRVWKNTRQLRDEMEVAMTVAIGEGQSASQMSRRVRQYLNDPDLMFRRFRYKDEDGNWQLKWKKRVMDDNGRYHFVDYDRNSYKVGAGNYKSSYKNAMRLTRTETNMAYRRADHDRWQGMEFVLGQKIETSNAHDPKEDKDICDELAGNYPKEFVFDGWHPQCMCMCTAIMVSEEEMVARMQARLRGEEYQFKEKPITTYPKGFRDFVKNNRQNIIDAQERGKQPYFLANNAGVVNDILNKDIVPDVREEDKSLVLSIQERANIRHAQRTPEQMQDIEKRWKDSRAVNTSLTESEKMMPGARQLFAEEMKSSNYRARLVAFGIREAAKRYEKDTKEMPILGYERQRDLLREKIANLGANGDERIEKIALQRLLTDVEGHIAKGEHRDPMELKVARQALRTEADKQAIIYKWNTREASQGVQKAMTDDEIRAKVREAFVAAKSSIDDKDIVIEDGHVLLNAQQAIKMHDLMATSQEEYKAIHDGYVGTADSFDINETARFNSSGEYDPLVGSFANAKNRYWGISQKVITTTEALDSAIAKNSLPFPVRITRMVDIGALETMAGLTKKIGASQSDIRDVFTKINALGKGATLSDAGYMSFSFDINANAFTGRKVKIIMDIPPRTPMYIANNISESEGILGRNTQMNMRTIGMGKMTTRWGDEDVLEVYCEISR